MAVLSFPVFVCVCVHLSWYGSNPDMSLCAAGPAIFNICVRFPQPRNSICERTASRKLPNGLLSILPQFQLEPESISCSAVTLKSIM